MSKRTRAFSGPHSQVAAVLCVALVTPLVVWAGSAEAQVSIQPLVISGDPAPGTPEGVVFKSFQGFSTWKESDGPMMNPNGRAAFIASLAGPAVEFANDAGLWAEADTGLVMVAREGSPAPGADDDWAGLVKTPAYSASGDLAVAAATRDGSTGIWLGPPEPRKDPACSLPIPPRRCQLSLSILRGDPVPDLAEDVFFIVALTPNINATGQIAFEASLSKEPDRGVLAGDIDVLGSVYYLGDPAPGAGQDATFTFGSDRVSAFGALLADDGSVAFEANTIEGDWLNGIWEATPMEDDFLLELVALGGDPAPGTMGNYTGQDFYSVARSASGVLAFKSAYDGPEEGIGLFASTSAGTELVAYTGGPVPGIDGPILSTLRFGPLIIRGGDMMVFAAGYRSPGGFAIFRGTRASLAPVAELGDPIPDLEGATWYDLEDAIVDINAAGHLALIARARGVNYPKDQALYLAPPNGAPRLVAQRGVLFEVRPGDARPIKEIGIATGHDRPYSALSDAGELLFRLVFEDDTEGLFTASVVPEPSLAASAFTVLGVLSGLRRRRSWLRRANSTGGRCTSSKAFELDVVLAKRQFLAST